MKDRIIAASIDALRKEGLRFSVDTLVDRLKISKKTVYKFFPDKEALSLALYEKYYGDARSRAAELGALEDAQSREELLRLYYDAKVMTRGDIFNKYKLNAAIDAFTARQNDALWELIAASLRADDDSRTLRIIVDGAFEKLCRDGLEPDKVIKRIVDILWQ